MTRLLTRVATAAALSTLGGCSGAQSVFNPLGPDAQDLTTLSIVLIAGATAILIVMIAATAIALSGAQRLRTRMADRRTIIIGGVVFPAVTLSALLIYGTLAMKAATAPADANALKIAIEGRQWWWRITYTMPDGRTFETANELRLPVGRQVALSLTSADVIHSFWVPSLAGKIDMIPGRTTHLRFTAMQPGTARGQCAEFCGGPHALMALRVVTMPLAAFARWQENERRDAITKAKGKDQFIASGCGACHTVRGTDASGRIAPDLTHVGARLSLAADTLPMSTENLARWITSNQTLKPGNHMAEFRHLGQSDIQELAGYLESLK